MKKTFLLGFIAILGGIFLLDGCKKGEGDPGISFKSRKGRLVGEWNISSQTIEGEVKLINKSNPPCTETTVIKVTGQYNGTTEIITFNATFSEDDCKQPPFKDTTIVTVTKDTSQRNVQITINKDGTYIWKESVTEESSGDQKDSTITGNWNFSAGVGEVKNKEQLLLSPTRLEIAKTEFGSTTTELTTFIFEGRDAQVYSIYKLSGSEVVLTWVDNSENVSGSTYARFTFEATLTPQ